jgi:hypothetical protein
MYFSLTNIFSTVITSDEAHVNDVCATSIIKTGLGRSILSENSRENAQVVTEVEEVVERGTFICSKLRVLSLGFQSSYRLVLCCLLNTAVSCANQ